MKRYSRIIEIGFLSCLFFWSCKKQELKWSSDWLAPIADGQIQLTDLVDNRFLVVNPEGWYDLVYDTTFEIGIDSLLTIEDTSIQLDYLIPVSVSVPPGVMLINETQNQSGLLPQDVQLKALELQSGMLHYRVENRIAGPLHCNYTIQRATIDGLPLEIDVEVAAGSSEVPGVIEGDLDLSQAHFDLTGVTGFLVNDLSTKMEVSTSQMASGNTAIFTGEKVSIEVSFLSPKVMYARGYFGQQEINEHQELSLGKAFPQGQIQWQSMNWDCEVQNWMGVDLLMNWGGIKFCKENKDTLVFHAPGIGQTLSIARAEDWFGAVNPQMLSLHWDEQNSNILDITKYLGGRALVEAGFKMNPLGNINGFNDFIYPDKMLSIHSVLHAPVAFNAKNLTAEDWLDIQWESNLDWNGKLVCQADNSFPFEADVMVMHEAELLGTIHVTAGGWDAMINAPIVESTTSNLMLNAKQWEGIKQNKGVRLRWVFNTTDYPKFVRVRPEQFARLKVIGDVTVQTTIE